MESLMGAIYPWPMTWAPQGFLMCDGQLLSINQYSALFSLLGTMYGGDGQYTFALPNLKGRVPVGAGNIPLGTMSGSTTATLTVAQLPAHSHTANAFVGKGTTHIPTGNLMADTSASVTPGATAADKDYVTAAAATTKPLVAKASTAIGHTGKSLPFSIVQANTAMNFIIAVEGIYPSRP